MLSHASDILDAQQTPMLIALKIYIRLRSTSKLSLIIGAHALMQYQLSEASYVGSTVPFPWIVLFVRKI